MFACCCVRALTDCLLSVARERGSTLVRYAVGGPFERQAGRKAGTVTSPSVGGVRSHCVSPSVDVPAKATRDASLQWPCHETSGKLPMTWQREPYARTRRLDDSNYRMVRSRRGLWFWQKDLPAWSFCSALCRFGKPELMWGCCPAVVPPPAFRVLLASTAMISDTQASYIRRQDARWSHEGSRSHSSNGLPWDGRARRRRHGEMENPRESFDLPCICITYLPR